MNLSKFSDLMLLSSTEISEAIIKTENKLVSLRLKKATRQSFKSHEIQLAKCYLAQLKMLLEIKLRNSHQ